MPFSTWSKVAALALLPLLPLAAIAQQAPDATDAKALAAPSTYVSAYANYRAFFDEKSTPDQVWLAANEAVREQDAHAGHAGIKPMEAGTPAPKADPHAGHHNMQGK